MQKKPRPKNNIAPPSIRRAIAQGIAAGLNGINSQSELARRLKPPRPPQHISRYLSGQRDIHTEFADEMLFALGINIRHEVEDPLRRDTEARRTKPRD